MSDYVGIDPARTRQFSGLLREAAGASADVLADVNAALTLSELTSGVPTLLAEFDEEMRLTATVLDERASYAEAYRLQCILPPTAPSAAEQQLTDSLNDWTGGADEQTWLERAGPVNTVVNVADVADVSMLAYAGTQIARHRFSAARAAAVTMESWTSFRARHAALPRAEARALYFATRKAPVRAAQVSAARSTAAAARHIDNVRTGNPAGLRPGVQRFVGPAMRGVGWAGMAYDGAELAATWHDAYENGWTAEHTESTVTNTLSLVGTGLMMSGNPVTIAIGAVLVGGVLIYENWDAISDWAGDAAEWTGDAFESAGDWAGDRVDDVGDALGDAGEAIGDGLSDAASWVNPWG
jgi:hypothetical protein